MNRIIIIAKQKHVGIIYNNLDETGIHYASDKRSGYCAKQNKAKGSYVFTVLQL